MSKSSINVALITPLLLFALLAETGNTAPEPTPDLAQVSSGLKPRPTPQKPANVSISSNVEVDHVVLKFSDAVQARFDGSTLHSEKGASLTRANAIVGQYLPNGFRRLFGGTAIQKLDLMRTVLSYKVKMELADLNGYYVIDILSPADAEQLINRLNSLDVVEIAYFQPKPEPAGIFTQTAVPNYQSMQDYREAAPDGIDADYANTLPGGDGTGIKIIDIEGNWNFTHIDLTKATGAHIAGALVNDPSWRNHGTAVIGEMIADDDGMGVVGICPGADIGTVSIGSMSTADAILTAVDTLQPGDAILIELHAPGPHFGFQPRPDQLGYVCMEYWQANFDAMFFAWATGITVVEAAGNGAENFDDALIYGSLFDTTFRNSHAIIAGAGHPPVDFTDLERESFSNFGERVNLQGYGSDIFTTGYGGLYSGSGVEDSFYTATFGGTSGASPIVTGAVACLQGRYKALYGTFMGSDQIRDILVVTGTPQSGNVNTEHIGPRPNLALAFTILPSPSAVFTEPIYIDTTIDENTVAVKPLWLHNRSTVESFEFTIADTDSLLKVVEPNWLRVSPNAGTILPQDSTLIDVTMDAVLVGDRISPYSGILEVNWGPISGPLDSLTLVPVFMEVSCFDTTYSSISSDDVGGPVYNWISAKALGFKVSNTSYYSSGSNPLDDGTTGPWTIGFDFPYYDTTYDQMYIGVNGALSFTDTNLNFNGFFGNLSIPNPQFSTLVSAFWNDLIFDTDLVPASGLYIYRNPTNDTTVIEWYKPGNFIGQFDTTTNFEIILTADGNITCQYFDVGQSGQEQTAVIGVNEIECAALKHYSFDDPESNLVDDSEAVQFTSNIWDYVLAGDVVPDNATNILDLTFMVDYNFRGGQPPDPFVLGDANCDGQPAQILDLTYLVDYVFRGGPPTCRFILRH